MTWPMVKLKNCCTIVGGATPRRDEKSFWNSPDIPWVTPKDISNLKNKIIDDAPEYISQLGFDKSATFMLPKGSVLLTSRAPIGNLAITGKPMCTNQGFKSLVPNPDVDCTYLYYCMLANTEKLQALGNGATFKEVSKKVVEDFEIPLPPLAEQKRIAAILDKADAIRQKRQQAIALADQFLRSVFLDMFGDPVTNPKGWDKRPLHEIASHIVDCPHSTPKWTDEGIIALRTSNLTKGGWDWADKRFVSELEYKERTKRSELVAKDLILSREGTIGIAALVPEGVKMCMGQRLVQIRVNDNHILPEYLLYLILIELEPNRISRLMTGSTSKHINVSDLKALDILLPPLAIQNKFAKTMTFLNNIKERLVLFYADSNMAFDAISKKAFSGQL